MIRLIYFLTFFIFGLTAYFGNANSVSAQISQIERSQMVRTELEYLDALNVDGFLYWQYSGPLDQDYGMIGFRFGRVTRFAEH
jgi:hypothetical protein